MTFPFIVFAHHYSITPAFRYRKELRAYSDMKQALIRRLWVVTTAREKIITTRPM